MIKHVTIFLCMLFVFIGVSAQTKTLTGTVKDANQEPLIGEYCRERHIKRHDYRS